MDKPITRPGAKRWLELDRILFAPRRKWNVYKGRHVVLRNVSFSEARAAATRLADRSPAASYGFGGPRHRSPSRRRG